MYHVCAWCPWKLEQGIASTLKRRQVQVVVNYHVVARNESRPCATATSAPKLCAISLASVV